VTSRPAAAQHLRDLARLRRVRDRIDREYAQPLDVEALARGAHMSAGHFSRQSRLAYGESPLPPARRPGRIPGLLSRPPGGGPPSLAGWARLRRTTNGEIAIRGDRAVDFRTSRSSLSQTIPTRPTTSGVTMTGPSTQGIKTVLHPVSDLATAKEVYAALLGVPPQTDESYYVGFESAGQHIGLVPGGGPQGMTSPVAYWHVPDLEAKLAEVTAAGATVKEPAHDVGGGRLVATVTDPDGNVLGLLQDR
jgi:predicted enzyme related to lactoylglutathione lyase